MLRRPARAAQLKTGNRPGRPGCQLWLQLWLQLQLWLKLWLQLWSPGPVLGNDMNNEALADQTEQLRGPGLQLWFCRSGALALESPALGLRAQMPNITLKAPDSALSAPPAKRRTHSHGQYGPWRTGTAHVNSHHSNAPRSVRVRVRVRVRVNVSVRVGV